MQIRQIMHRTMGRNDQLWGHGSKVNVTDADVTFVGRPGGSIICDPFGRGGFLDVAILLLGQF